MSNLRRLPSLLLVASCFMFCQSADAGEIPIFRYALDKWDADLFDVIVFHRGELGDEDQVLVQQLEESSIAGGLDGATSNIRVIPIDLESDVTADMQALWRKLKANQVPLMVVRFPAWLGFESPVWSGPLSKQAVDNVMHSPKRFEIARHILDGKTAVWVLLESGAKFIDDKAFATLNAELKKAENSIKIDRNRIGKDEEFERDTKVPLKISFAVMRLSRTDKNEKFLASMLMGIEADLHEYPEDPIAIPVFGRGRALYALIGDDGITPDGISVACQELTAKTTNTIKAKTSGVDLMMSVDWPNLIKGHGKLGRPVTRPSNPKIVRPDPPKPAPVQPVKKEPEIVKTPTPPVKHVDPKPVKPAPKPVKTVQVTPEKTDNGEQVKAPVIPVATKGDGPIRPKTPLPIVLVIVLAAAVLIMSAAIIRARSRYQ